MSADTKRLAPELPPALVAVTEALLDARGNERRVQRIFERSSVPMVMLDDQARYVDVNPPARLLAQRSLEEIRGRRLSDLSPPEDRPRVEANWRQLRERGFVSGPYRRKRLDGSHVDTYYVGITDIVTGRHVYAYAPATWRGNELSPSQADGPLTPRELEVLELAAEGLTSTQMAGRLFVSPGTVKTHLTHIYDKLGVSDRASAVATGLRLGLID